MPYVSSFARRLCPAEADDLVQETMARALRSWGTYHPDRPLRGWLLKIAFRAFLDHRRKAGRTPDPIGTAADRSVAPPPDRLEAAELLARIATRLEPVEHDILLRFHRDGQPVDSIAGALAMPAGTVKSHLHRARRKLARAPEGDRPS